MIPFFDLKFQYTALMPTINERINRVLEHGQFIMGPEVNELEEKLADYVGVDFCIATSSGTDTLLISMLALGIGRGDEVITTPFTFVSACEMISLLGAKPVFVDIDARTFNIDAAKIEERITTKTKAIIPVSLYGQCADMDAINKIATKYSLPVIEDAAQSFGAIYKGKRSCSLSTIGSTSFFPSKPLGGYGDSGAIFTNDKEIANEMRQIRLHGQKHRYQHNRIGINGRMDTIQAAIILAKFERFPWEILRRQQIGKKYDSLISQKDTDIVTPYIEPHNESVYGQYTVQLSNRSSIVEALSKHEIPSAIHYPVPLHLQKVFSKLGYKEGDFPMAEAASRRVLSLPMWPDMTIQYQEKIINALTSEYKKFKVCCN